jgi:hypothetical protein
MTHPLDGAWLKRNRASEHFKTLNDEVAASRERNPYRLRPIEFDPKEGRYPLRIEVVEEPPARWGVLAGEFFYDLRSALDNLAWQLALAGCVPIVL